MLPYITDAHSHFCTSANLSDECVKPPSYLRCVSLCFPDEWGKAQEMQSELVSKGLHPKILEKELANGAIENLLEELESDCKKGVFAIGECGLDKFVKAPQEQQEALFESQLSLALKLKKPLIIHCVGRYGRLLEIIKSKNLRGGACGGSSGSSNGNLRGGVGDGFKFLVHAPSCSADVARELEKEGGYFSFGARELAKKKGRDCACHVNLERILIESDSVMTSSLYSQCVKKISDIRNIDQEKVSDIVGKNFKDFFGI